MDYTLATNQQLWTIMKSDAECPLPLLEGVFHEAVNRKMIVPLILTVIKKKFGSSEQARKALEMEHDDLIQLGYEGALRAIQEYKPGKGIFSSFLYRNISHAYGWRYQFLKAHKRQIEESSYHQNLEEDSTLEYYYLVDLKTNVEKTVLDKIQFEEKLSTLSDVQRDTFMRFFKGFTYKEIAEQMGTKKSCISSRMKKCFIKMTGHDVNLRDLGLVERVSFKKQGA